MFKKIILLIISMAILFTCAESNGQSFAPDTEKTGCPRAPKSEDDRIVCQSLINKYPKDPDLYFNIGNYYLSFVHDRNSAKSFYRKGLEISPDYYRSYIVTSLLAELDGNLDQAISDLGKAIARNPKDPMAYENRGNIYDKKNENEKSLADYNEALKLNSANAALYYKRGQILSRLGRVDAANADYSQAAKLDPSIANSNDDKCGSLEGKAGVAQCTKAISQNPNNADAYNDRGISFENMGQHNQAIKDYSKALKIKPDFAIAYTNRGNAFHSKGDFKHALEDHNKAIKLEPTDANFLYNRGNLFKDTGDYDKAIQDYTNAIKFNPAFTNSYENRGFCLAKKGEYQKAIQDFDEAIRKDSNNDSAYNSRGYSWSKLGSYDKAIKDILEASKIDPANKMYKQNIKILENEKGKHSIFNNYAQDKADIKELDRDAKIPSIETGKRSALIMGNGNYKYVPHLENPPNDIDLLSNTLRKAGFDPVIVKNDLTREGMVSTLREFGHIADSSDWAVVYYSGHGIEQAGVNYLIPVDAQLKADRDVELEAINLGQIIRITEGARKIRIVMLDACRDNPFASQMRRTLASRSIGRGLAQVEPEAGTLIVYAAKHGEVALDGEGKNSPFAESLAKHILTPNIEIRRLFDKVRDEVMSETMKKQQPFSYGSISGSEDFYFLQK